MSDSNSSWNAESLVQWYKNGNGEPLVYVGKPFLSKPGEKWEESTDCAIILGKALLGTLLGAFGGSEGVDKYICAQCLEDGDDIKVVLTRPEDEEISTLSKNSIERIYEYSSRIELISNVAGRIITIINDNVFNGNQSVRLRCPCSKGNCSKANSWVDFEQAAFLNVLPSSQTTEANRDGLIFDELWKKTTFFGWYTSLDIVIKVKNYHEETDDDSIVSLCHFPEFFKGNAIIEQIGSDDESKSLSRDSNGQCGYEKAIAQYIQAHKNKFSDKIVTLWLGLDPASMNDQVGDNPASANLISSFWTIVVSGEVSKQVDDLVKELKNRVGGLKFQMLRFLAYELLQENAKNEISLKKLNKKLEKENKENKKSADKFRRIEKDLKHMSKLVNGVSENINNIDAVLNPQRGITPCRHVIGDIFSNNSGAHVPHQPLDLGSPIYCNHNIDADNVSKDEQRIVLLIILRLLGQKTESWKIGKGDLDVLIKIEVEELFVRMSEYELLKVITPCCCKFTTLVPPLRVEQVCDAFTDDIGKGTAKALTGVKRHFHRIFKENSEDLLLDDFLNFLPMIQKAPEFNQKQFITLLKDHSFAFDSYGYLIEFVVDILFCQFRKAGKSELKCDFAFNEQSEELCFSFDYQLYSCGTNTNPLILIKNIEEGCRNGVVTVSPSDGDWEGILDRLFQHSNEKCKFSGSFCSEKKITTLTWKRKTDNKETLMITLSDAGILIKNFKDNINDIDTK